MQLLLWDNLPLENCYKLILQLKFEEVIAETTKIKQLYPNHQNEIKELIDISNFWKDFIDEDLKPKTNINTIFNLWTSYPFPTLFKNLKVKILRWIAENVLKCTSDEEEMFDKLFLQLESHCCHQLNLELTELLISQKPSSFHFLFYKSRAQWNLGKIADAKINLCLACWFNESWKDFSFIKNEELRAIAQQHGIEWLPAFGYALLKLPSIPNENLKKFTCLIEKTYFNAYIWVVKLQESQVQQDKESSLIYRKKIKLHNEALFQLCMKSFIY